ncbi:basic proline-rich protein-like [Vulpes lagopus]|uniref:basic proline-rich protein-like n=1 Tax=Vulpes lagopus TaxID=494514 RepID=UPI001BC9E9A8|nr:basic proline-rich protein-like [Vulpes lagopus]
MTSSHSPTGSRDPQPTLPGLPRLSPLPLRGGGCRPPPPHRPSAAQKLGAPPVASQPWPPLTSAAPLHARPGPPPALHRRAARLQPARPLGGARPGPAPPPRRPRPDRPPAARVGGAARGRGPRGVPAPGADTRSTPRHARPAGLTRGRAAGLGTPPSPVGSGLGGGGGSPSTPTRAPGPAAAGHCSSTKGQAPRRPPFPLRSSGRSLPRKTHSGFGVPSGVRRVSPPTLPGRRGPAPQGRSRTPARAVPAPPPAVEGGRFGFAAAAPPGGAFGGYTATPPTLGAPTGLPSTSSPVGGQEAGTSGGVPPGPPPSTVTGQPFSPTPAKYGTAEHPVSWGSVRASGAAPGTARAPRLRAPRPQCGTLSSLHSLASPDRESSLRTRHVREAGVPTPPRPHHSPRPPAPPPPLPLPPSSCSSAGTSPPQICRLPASSGLRTPGARRARPGGTGRGGAAEAAPPTQGGEWSAQHPLYGGPGTQPSSSSAAAGGCPSGLRLHSFLDLVFDLGKGANST